MKIEDIGAIMQMIDNLAATDPSPTEKFRGSKLLKNLRSRQMFDLWEKF